MSREPGAMTEHVVTERDAQGRVVCTVEREITVEDLLLRKIEKDLRTYVRRCIAEVRGIPGTVGGTLRDTIPVDEAVADELTAAGVDVATSATSARTPRPGGRSATRRSSSVFG